MKVLDVDLLQRGVQKNIVMLSRLRSEMDAIISNVTALVALEDVLKGQGGDSIRAFYAECHLPFLQFFMTFEERFTQALNSMEAALHAFEPDDTGFIRESFLEQEIEQGLQHIAQLTESLTNEANSIMGQVSDIVYLPHLDDSEVHEGVRNAKMKRNDTNARLYEFDGNQTNALATIEQDLITMEIWLLDIQGLFTSDLTDIHFPADQWTAISSKNTLWTDLIQRTMPMGNPFTPRGVGGSRPFPYTLLLDYGNLMGVQQSNNMFDGEIAEPENTGVAIAKGVGVGLYDAGKDFVTGIWDFIVNPKESIESVVHAATHPVETFTYLKTAISDSYENDVVNGDAYSRSRWFSYAIGTVGASIVGTKGAGALTKTGVATTKSAVQKGVATAQSAMQSPRLAQILPYGPHMQVAMPGGVPFNVMNGPVKREQLISMAKVIEVKGMGKPLLPGEGKVGTYEELIDAGTRGDNDYSTSYAFCKIY